MNSSIPWKEILSTAVHAPSGDNAQPWIFEVRGETLLLFNRPERDATLYNFRQRGSFVAHGALIENIALLAAGEGFDSNVELFPGGEDCIARITCEPAPPTPEPLADAIPRRVTNRKPYDGRKLDGVHARKLVESARYATLRLVDGAVLRALSSTLSVNERLLFENRDLHDFLFSMIRWTRADETGRPGLYVKTMEFPLPLQFLLRHVFRHWGAVTLLNRIGLSRAIPKQSSALYATSSAFGAIVIPDDTDASYVAAGRAFERIWLTATACGLALQPVTALPYLAARIKAGEGDMFTVKQKRLVLDAYEEVARAFTLEGTEGIAMLFRVGYAQPPSAQSAKMPPEIRYN